MILVNDDVKVEEAVTTQPVVETETTQPSAEGEPKTTDAPVVPENTPVTPETHPEVENYKKALQQERQMRKQYARELAQYRGSVQPEAPQSQQGVNPSDYEEAMLKLAEYQLKEGVQEILDAYPQLDKATVNAIKRNPRGFVNPGTMDIQNALLDIADYVEEYVTNEGFTSNNTPQPRTVPIMGNNAPAQEDNVDAEVQRLVNEVPPEDWTPEEAALVSKAAKNIKR